MKMTFRWFGDSDPISLEAIGQIPNMNGVVTALYDVPVGEVWPLERILEQKRKCEAHGLNMEVIESVPVHEDIKLGLPSREKFIENYAQTIRNLGVAGVRCVCYNFMPVFDWVRTDLKQVASDGSDSLSYCHAQLMRLDPRNLHLPGWDESYSPDELQGLLGQYRTVTRERLFENLVYFLERILPACEEAEIDLAIHPDDPPWELFGLPRIVSNAEDLARLFKAVPNRRNGLTFCTGSLGAGRCNRLADMVKQFSGRIFFAHIRQIRYVGERDFEEAGHLTSSGSLDICGIVRALVASGFKGYVRPDHGRNIWGESGRPGYGLYDRALGAAYLNGLFEASERME